MSFLCKHGGGECIEMWLVFLAIHASRKLTQSRIEQYGAKAAQMSAQTMQGIPARNPPTPDLPLMSHLSSKDAVHEGNVLGAGVRRGQQAEDAGRNVGALPQPVYVEERLGKRGRENRGTPTRALSFFIPGLGQQGLVHDIGGLIHRIPVLP